MQLQQKVDRVYNSLQISGGDNLDMEYLEQFYIFIVLRQQLVFLNKYIYFSLNQVYIFFSEHSLRTPYALLKLS